MRGLRRVGLGLLAAVTLVAACSSEDTNSDVADDAVADLASTVPAAGTAPPTTAAPACPGPLLGLVDRRGAPPAEWVDALGGYVVNLTWADVHPVAGTVDLDGVVAELDAAAASGLGVRVRILAGVNAPGWVLESAGTLPWGAPGAAEGELVTAPRWWEPPYQEAYAELMAGVAAALDGHPAFRSVAISGGGVVFAEPMIRTLRDAPENATRAAEAGWTLEGELASQQAFVRAHLPFECAWSYLAANPFQRLDTSTSDVELALELLGEARAILGDRLEVANNSVRVPPIEGYGPLYEGMAALGPPIAVQTARAAAVGDLPGAIAEAAALGARSVELPVPAYRELLTPAQAAELTDTLATE